MKVLFGSPRLGALMLFGCAALFAGSLSAVPITLKYQVTPQAGGVFQYDFILHVDNNDNTYQLGQGWRWLIFGDTPSGPSPLTAWTIGSGQLPVGPWTQMSSSGGGHNGPTFSDVLTYWIPNGIGDALHWRGTSTADLAQGQLLWSTIAGTLGGGVAANFTVAQRLDPGIRVEVTTGTSAVVLNDETGGGNGFPAGTFTLQNTGSAAATVTNIQLRGMGNGNHLASYTEVAIYRDQTASGTVGSYDTGDALVATLASFSGAPPLANFAVSGSEQNFAVSELKTYFVVVELNGTAPASDTLSYRVNDVTVGGATLFGVPSRVMAGLFILGPEVAYDGIAPTINPNVVPGNSDVPVMAFDLSATTTDAQTISSITLTKTGTIADSDITAVKLFEDVNGNARLDTGEPQVGSTQTLSSGTATFTGSPLISLAAGQSKAYLLTYSIATGVANGTTAGADLTPVSDIASNPGPTRENTPSPNFALTVFVVSSYPYLETFDSFTYSGYVPLLPNPLINGWHNDRTDGGRDWMTYQGTTPSSGTGPAVGDHTSGTASGGRYLFVEDGDNSAANGFLNLISPAFDISGLGLPVAEFWLHDLTNGGQIIHNNTLHVDLIDASSGAITNDIVSPITGSNNPNWFLVSVDLSAVTANVVNIRLRWQGTGTSFNNDMCVDDFGVRDTPDINIQNASAANIASGGTDSVGGVMTTGQTFTWTIQNLGGVDLNLTGSPTVSVSPISNVNATVTAFPSSTISGSSSSTFDVLVEPLAAGAFSFTVQIPNNDPNENPYTFTVDGTGVANQPPQISIPAGSGWVSLGGGGYELALDPGAAYDDDLEVTDPTPDDMTLTVTPPGTVPTTVTNSPASIGTPTPGPFTLNWTGTADATNPPGNYTWQLSVSDGISTVNFTAWITINDLAPTHAIGTDATSGDGLSSATAYNGSALVGSTAALTLADVDNPNTGQATTLGTVTPNGANPAGGSGFNITLVGNSIVATPTAALQLADLGTHEFTVDVEDAGNTTTLHVSVTVVSPEISVDRAGAIPSGGTDTVTGALAGQPTVLTYTISNTGSSALNISTVVTSNAVNCTANVTANPAGVVNPGNSTTVDVTVTPGVGAFSFDMDINNDDVDENPYEIAVSGNAAAAPEFDLDRAGAPIADSGSDSVPNTDVDQNRNLVYTITNNGTSDLSVGAVTLGIPVNCTASVTVNPAATVTPGNSTTFTVRVKPSAQGLFSVSVAIVNDDANENPYNFDITGTATSAGGNTGGGGGGGGGGCSGAGGSSVALLALLGIAALRMRRRRA